MNRSDFMYRFNHNGFVVFYRGKLIGRFCTDEMAYEQERLCPEALPWRFYRGSVNPEVSEMWANVFIDHVLANRAPQFIYDRMLTIDKE